MKIAIADDDPIVCSSLQTILTASGTADVLWTANDGEETCRQYMAGPAQHPDVLLVDVQMPGLNGIEAARKILEFDKAARILFLTTFADQQYISQAMALGARGYLIKQDVASGLPGRTGGNGRSDCAGSRGAWQTDRFPIEPERSCGKPPYGKRLR